MQWNKNIQTGVRTRDQRLPFMFETTGIQTAGAQANRYQPSSEYVLPINPEMYRIAYPTRANATQTIGGAFQDNIGLGLPKISMQGTFGYLGNQVGGHGMTLGSKVKDAWEMFIELEQTFMLFYQRFGTYTLRGEKVDEVFQGKIDPKTPPRLSFYNYTDRDFFVVQLDRFEFQRNIQRRFLYMYDIQMTVLQRIDAPIDEDALAEYLGLTNIAVPADDLSIWGKLLKGYTWAYNAMNDVSNRVDQLRGTMQTIRQSVAGFRQGISDTINAPFALVNEAIATTDSILNTVIFIKDLPHEFIQDLRSTKRALLMLSLHKDQFRVSATTTTSGPSTLPADSDPKEIVAGPTPENVGQDAFVAMDNPETTIFSELLESEQLIASQVEPVNHGDTMESLASRILGDASQWKQIAMLNGLEYPFIAKEWFDAFSPALLKGRITVPASAYAINLCTDINPDHGQILLLQEGETHEYAPIIAARNGIITISTPLQNSYSTAATVSSHATRRNVIFPGDQIRIPGTRTGVSAITADDPDFYAQLLGTDESIGVSGKPEAAINDLYVSGVTNLEMQLQHRLTTMRGELAALGHPQYGSLLPLYVGRVSTPMWHERALLEAELTIVQDPRVAAVERLDFNVDNTAITILADVVLVGQTSATRMRLLIG